jgi:hypothetical protein
MKMKLAVNMHTQTLITICLQFKRISESVPIIQNVRLPGERDDSNFTEIRLHEICRTPFVYTINILP